MTSPGDRRSVAFWNTGFLCSCLLAVRSGGTDRYGAFDVIEGPAPTPPARPSAPFRDAGVIVSWAPFSKRWIRWRLRDAPMRTNHGHQTAIKTCPITCTSTQRFSVRFWIIQALQLNMDSRRMSRPTCQSPQAGHILSYPGNMIRNSIIVDSNSLFPT